MSSEKTEKATPKRREDARKKGQIARGTEFPAALAFLSAVVVMQIVARDIFLKSGVYFRNSAQQIVNIKTLTDADLQAVFIDAVRFLAFLSFPVMIVGFVGVLVGYYVQGGTAMSASSLKPKVEKFNAVKNLKRIFGTDSLFNLGKSMLKLIVIVFVAYGVLAPVFENAPKYIYAPLPTVAVWLGETLYSLAFRCGLALLILGLADYGYAWYKHEKSLRMTKQEIRDEFKQQEGDPMVKGQRRRVARDLVQSRSLANVPTASVVVTNPTHYAVALRYDREKDAAPVVVAKGADIIAAKIRTMAKEYDIPLVENPPLARALYATVEPNHMIPVEFFGTVAEILAFVFRQKDD
jgi:flagellar biosynthetic protein FlhB